MALVVRELTAATLSDADAAGADVASWWSTSHRCSPLFTFPSAEELRGYLNDAAKRERVAVVFDNVANKVVGLATFRPAVDRIHWLVARPAQFSAVADQLGSAILARTTRRPWGVVEVDTTRDVFLTGAWVPLAWADIPETHVARRYPDGQAIIYSGA